MNTSENNLLSRRNDEEAINELIIKYKYLVDGAAAKFQNAPLEKDEIIQEGLIGLLAATKSFNESKGTLFTTYASHCINNSIISAIKKVSRLKDIPQSNIVSIENEDMFDEKVHLSAEDEYMASESVSVLSNVLYEELSSFENEVLRLHIMGCSYAETAQKLDKTPKAVDNAMQRIRKKLSQVSFE